MKKLLIVLLIFTLFVVGCKSDNTNKESNTTDIDNTNNNEQENESYNIDTSKVVGDLSNGGTLYYSENRDIFIGKDNTFIKVSENMPSYPEISPDKKKIAYIDNFDFETIGNLNIYSTETNKNLQKTKFDYSQSDTVKQVKWLTNNEICLIIGYTYGTITKGGSLYEYNLKEDKLTLLVESEELMEVKDVKVVDGKITITKVMWKDDNYIEYEMKDEEVSLDN
jgi:thioredoxin-related protein